MPGYTGQALASPYQTSGSQGKQGTGGYYNTQKPSYAQNPQASPQQQDIDGASQHQQQQSGYSVPPPQQQQSLYDFWQQQEPVSSPIYVGPAVGNLQQPHHHMFQEFNRVLSETKTEQRDAAPSTVGEPVVDDEKVEKKSDMHEEEEDADLRSAVHMEDIEICKYYEDYDSEDGSDLGKAFDGSNLDEERLLHPKRYFRTLDKLQDEVKAGSVSQYLLHIVSLLH
jgi:hypothetical protein